ncbi:recombination protein RecR [bacterium]|nr:recombination protein RecR [bacterium]
MAYPRPFRRLIEELKQWPQIGEKTAERLAVYLYRVGEKKRKELISALKNLGRLKECQRCFNLSEEDLCEICQDKSRNQKVIAVVESPLDIAVLERAGFRGVYFVLGGLITSLLEENAELHLKELEERVKKEKPKEVILALDASLEGDTTSAYVAEHLRRIAPKLKITRLAYGLPLGADLEYMDETTLREALRGRKEI